MLPAPRARRLGGRREPSNGSKDAADGVVASIVDAGGVAAAFPADVGVEEDVVAMFAAIDDWALAVDGVVAGLVNNAGVLTGPNGCKSVEHASLEDLNAIFAVNVAGPMLCTREALRPCQNLSRRAGRAAPS